MVDTARSEHRFGDMRDPKGRFIERIWCDGTAAHKHEFDPYGNRRDNWTTYSRGCDTSKQSWAEAFPDGRVYCPDGCRHAAWERTVSWISADVGQFIAD